MPRPLISLLDRLPYVGVITDWNGFLKIGKIDCLKLGCSIKIKDTCHEGSLTGVTNFIGKHCLFSPGKEPRYPFEEIATQWIIEDFVEGNIGEYLSGRDAPIEYPESTQPEHILNLIKEKVESDIYNYSSSEKIEIWENELRRLASDPILFRDFSIEKLIAFFEKIPVEQKNLFTELKRKFIETLINIALAIDIESDGERIFQIGIVQHNRSPRLFEMGENGTDLKEILRELVHLFEASLVVGHNVIRWDLPAIERACSSLNIPFHSPRLVWDTMLVSFIREPWKSTHALKGSAVPHRADADAVAAFDLFSEQCANFLFDNEKTNSIQLIDRYLEFLKESKREYPKPSTYLTRICHDEAEESWVVVPESSLEHCFWVPGVCYDWPCGIRNFDDRSISAKLIKRNIDESDPFHKLLWAIIEDAERNEVQVLVRMLPLWLRARCDSLLEKCPLDLKCPESFLDINAKWRVFTYESFLNPTPEARAIYKKAIKKEPEIARISFLKVVEEMHHSKANHLIHGIDTDSMPSFERDRLEKDLKSRYQLRQIVGTDQGDGRFWFEFHPARRKQERPWRLWFAQNAPDSENQLVSHNCSNSQISGSAIIPDWLEAERTDEIEYQGHWPTTTNRFAYWHELIAKFLSCRANNPAGSMLLLILEDRAELDAAKRLFFDLGIGPNMSESVFKTLSRCFRSPSVSCAVDVVENVNHWIRVAEDHSVDIRFVVAEVPLSSWLMCLPSDGAQSEPIREISGGDGKDVDFEENGPELDEYEERDNFPFTKENVVAAVRMYFLPWRKSVFKENKPIIVDSRISRLFKSTSDEQIIRTALTEKQKGILECYREEFGGGVSEEPPATYEKYEKFLNDNWRWAESEPSWRFREETQKPVVQAICETNRDLLVRLPTGEGKSVLFQVPALFNGLHTQRLTIVVTPLRALMRDQVVSLWKKGFQSSVDYLSGDRAPWDTDDVYQGILDNRIKLLYVAPERFRVSRFRNILERRIRNDGGLEFAVVDEAHCVSQWGHEFRPDYLFALGEINRLVRFGPNPSRVLLFSATVTRIVENELRKLLSARDPQSMLLRPEAFFHPIQAFIRIIPEPMACPIFGSTADAGMTERVGAVQEIIEKAKPDTKRSVVIVFVNRRDHAKRVAAYLGDSLPSYRVDYFHAGLPPDERLGVYESVRSGETNVLVATKAFGMGMDIPNIHWCIHLSPPAFLEDYLQEVGRTGRGAEDREKAGLAEIECTLLHHAGDFERNLELVRRNSIQPPDLVFLWQEIQKYTKKIPSGKSLSFLPVEGNRELSGDRLRKGLSWLERSPAKRLSILGQIPNVLQIRMNRVSLLAISKEVGPKGVLAKALLRPIEGIPDTEGLQISSSGVQEGFWHHIKRFFGFTISDPGTTCEVDERNDDPWREAEVFLGTILVESELKGEDELFFALAELCRIRAILIPRSLTFERGRHLDESPAIWGWVERISCSLLELAQTGDGELELDELRNQILEPENADQRRRSMAESTVRSVFRLASASGLRIRERLNSENNLVYRYSMGGARAHMVLRRMISLVEKAKKLEGFLVGKIDAPVELSDLLEVLVDGVRYRDLSPALRLLSDVGLFHCKQPIVGRTYVLNIEVPEPLYDKSSNNIRPADLKMYEDLEKVNRSSELRSFAMAMFARIREDANRRSYIDRYFLLDSPEEMENFLLREAGGSEDSPVPGELGEMVGLLRQEAMKRALARFESGDEPSQFKACSHPWNRNLIVNAGPGSGKTEVLMMRAAHLIHQQGLRPEQVLILAFNRAVVHEIKTRINRLFADLGYGGYARRLKVRTFHSFALEIEVSQAGNARYEIGELEQVVERFSARCIHDAVFARNAIAGVRAILVDEFQDMNDVRYGMLKALVSAANEDLQQPRIGIMAIGDDDQDILVWNRRPKREALQYFEEFKSDFSPVDEFALKINFRSAKEIVDSSQRFLDDNLLGEPIRIKSDICLSPSKDALPGEIGTEFQITIDGISGLLDDCKEREETCALLCRTNEEVSFWYDKLHQGNPGLRIQGGKENLQIGKFRHNAVWLDCCRRVREMEGNMNLNEDTFLKISDLCEQTGIPDAKKANNKNGVIRFVWESILDENPNAIMEDFLGFMGELNTGDYLRMMGKTKLGKWIEYRENMRIGKSVVSTIHKIKGLEFDTVAIMSALPRSSGKNISSREVVRLFYVAMTRAKRRLLYSYNDGQGIAGMVGDVYLSGSPEEVFVSFPGFDDSIQEYLKSQIRSGDELKLSMGANYVNLKHCNKIIGKLSSAITKRVNTNSLQNSRVKVHSIYRYPITDKMQPNFLESLTHQVRNQGWYYTVLVKGFVP